MPKTVHPGLKPFQKGPDARRGVGKKGRSGRPPDAFKAFLATLRSDPKALAAVKRAAVDETGRNFATAWKLASDYDESKPAGKTDITSGGKVLHGVVILPSTADE